MTGEAVSEGTVGLSICTGLINDAQVLIRYRIGDRRALSDEGCRCESSLPVLKSIEGRGNDLFFLLDGCPLGILGTNCMGCHA
jgi:phenylacetate-CoA ligase